MGNTRKVILQTSRKNGEEEREVSYIICNDCISEYGVVVRFWKKEDGEVLAYFQKEREEGVKVNFELVN